MEEVLRLQADAASEEIPFCFVPSLSSVTPACRGDY